MNTARLVLDAPANTAGGVRFASRLVEADGSAQQLWWDVPEAWADSVTKWSDPAVIGFIFAIMQRDRPVMIEGKASPSLLANLELLMGIWQQWVPGKYRAVGLAAEEEVELPPAREPGKAVVSFSCGLDSCFTAYRHTRKLAGRRSRDIGVGIMQHGFDVKLNQQSGSSVYGALLADAGTMLGSLGIPCAPIVTNFRQLDHDWADALGAQIAAGLALFSGRYDTGLIANDLPYSRLGSKPFPLHPAVTINFSSQGFRVIDDGGEHSRTDKADLVSDWPEAMRLLRVCFGADMPGSHANCGRCEKCIRTLLSFRVRGRPRPASFAQDPSPEQIAAVRLTNLSREIQWRDLAEEAVQAGFGDTDWARAIRTTLRRNDWRATRARLQRPFVPLRDLFRQWRRGTTLSRSQIAKLSDRQ